jgi:hypothetical protein
LNRFNLTLHTEEGSYTKKLAVTSYDCFSTKSAPPQQKKLPGNSLPKCLKGANFKYEKYFLLGAFLF